MGKRGLWRVFPHFPALFSSHRDLPLQGCSQCWGAARRARWKAVEWPATWPMWARQTQNRKEKWHAKSWFTPFQTHYLQTGGHLGAAATAPWWPQPHKCLCPLVTTWRGRDPCSPLISPLDEMGNYVKAGRFAKWERLTGAYKTKTPSQIPTRRELLLRVISAPAFPSVKCLVFWMQTPLFLGMHAWNLPSCPVLTETDLI